MYVMTALRDSNVVRVAIRPNARGGRTCGRACALPCLNPVLPARGGGCTEGTSHGHDAIAPAKGIPYLEARGHTAAAAYIKSIKPPKEYAACNLRRSIGH